ncbi:hypothetical protein [Amycolatopsis sp.]|uniref:hypothetical protein n=1 Tax=Amycolatopsis sp. TaxID=37632 RepID=UPI002E01D712|nr:hypothetical protein [Amycolatopsis sp.]
MDRLPPPPAPQRPAPRFEDPRDTEMTRKIPRITGESTGSRRAVKPPAVRAGEAARSRPAMKPASPAETTGGGRRRAPESAPVRASESTGSRRAVKPASRGISETTGSHRALGGRSVTSTTGSHRAITADTEAPAKPKFDSTATGSHRVMGATAPRRRVAKWPIACVVLVGLIVLGVFGWNWADGLLNSRAEAQAVGCPEGNSTIKVLVAPAIEKPVVAAAAKWNQKNTVVYAHCIHVDVQSSKSEPVFKALSGETAMDTIGGIPAAWVPESSYWTSQLQRAKPELVGSPAQSVASAISADYPFLGLAGTGVDDTQKRAAQTFREFLKEPAQQKDFTDAGIKAT